MVCGTTGSPTSDCIVKRVFVESTSTCRTIFQSFRLVVCIWVPFHISTTSNVFCQHTPNERIDEHLGALSSLFFQPLSSSLTVWNDFSHVELA
ncbi:hypothetical protein TNCT_649691 [Trichonephila clavata]|uniref:Uncharacterized protein n=1 Tax=Trichonephila clavata TaxID=2740835 RepID=A0A8X6FU33_TRICU|nr:hypothetical protein TNCT_649691 [Trichonephila clavata]